MTILPLTFIFDNFFRLIGAIRKKHSFYIYLVTLSFFISFFLLSSFFSFTDHGVALPCRSFCGNHPKPGLTLAIALVGADLAVAQKILDDIQVGNYIFLVSAAK